MIDFLLVTQSHKKLDEENFSIKWICHLIKYNFLLLIKYEIISISIKDITLFIFVIYRFIVFLRSALMIYVTLIICEFSHP